MSKPQKLFNRRRKRVRRRVKLAAHRRPRLSVYRSVHNIYAQIIDDVKGVTLAAASTLDPELRDSTERRNNKDAAAKVGKLIGERAVSAGVKDVVFDRGAYLYHGRVKSLGDAAREAGLNF